MNILIVGGGIGGLSAALCLAKTGYSVDVLEQASQFTEAGAGIQLSPNCSQVLLHLGLKSDLDDLGFLPTAIQFRQWHSGKVISEQPLEHAVEQFGSPYYHIHRGDLLHILVKAANVHPNIRLHTNVHVETFSETSQGIEVNSSEQSFSGDVLVGADGIHSSVRRQLWGEQAPNFTGNIAWRALVPSNNLPSGLIRPMSTAWWGPGKHFVHYYVGGGKYVNCVCVVEKQGWQIESWTEPGELTELKADFSGWHKEIQMLFDGMQVDSLFKWALFDRAPMPKWGKGCATLLGDACHPTLPFMAQGAAMAIEDAAVLAGCLKQVQTPQPHKISDALQRYENLRKKRTAGIQLGSRRNAKTFHLSGIKAWLRNRAARAAGASVTNRLYAYDALTAANRQTS